MCQLPADPFLSPALLILRRVRTVASYRRLDRTLDLADRAIAAWSRAERVQERRLRELAVQRMDQQQLEAAGTLRALLLGRIDLAGADIVAAEPPQLLPESTLHLLADHGLLESAQCALLAQLARTVLAPMEPHTTFSWREVRDAEEAAEALTERAVLSLRVLS